MRQAMAWAPLCLLLASLAAVGARRCCPGDEMLHMVEKRCSVTSTHRPLNCTNGMYIIDPEKSLENELFVVTADDHLQLDDGELVPPDSYCVSHLHRKDGTLTNEEVAFVCFPDTKDAYIDEATRLPRHQVIGVCVAVSTVFLLATLVVYAVLPEMYDLEGKCLMCAVLALFVSFVLLAMLQFEGAHLARSSCIATAFGLYFWLLAAFFWLNVVSCNLWRTVVYPNSVWSERRIFASYCGYGWGCPAVFVVVALITHHLPDNHQIRPGFGETSCWFHGSVEIWSYFYGPVAVIIACNIVFFVWTALTLWRSCSDSAPKLHSMKYKCALYTKLFVIMGITWIFELLSHFVDPSSQSYVWFATDILNSLQGLLIFIITVACRKRVLRGLARRRPCGFDWPKKWAAGVDEESDAIATDEIAEMSQPALEPGSPTSP